MSLEMPNQNPLSVREKFLSKADKDGYVFLVDFATQELKRQAKSVASFLYEI